MADISEKPEMIDAVIGVGFPKAGNTMLGKGITAAGRRLDPSSGGIFSVGRMIRQKVVPRANALLSARSPVAYVKTHHFKPYGRFPHSDIVNPLKVIRITRNPLDTLLSYVNFTRTAALNSPREKLPAQLRNFISRDIGFETEGLTNEQWGDQATLENLKEGGYLEKALASFSNRELAIRPLVPASGSWSRHILSWEDAPLEVHTVRYEDFIAETENEIGRLASFLDVDEQTLALGFRDQEDHLLQVRGSTSSEGRPSRVFFNRMTANYFVEFFDHQSVRNFIDRHWAILRACGYADWCELAFHTDY